MTPIPLDVATLQPGDEVWVLADRWHKARVVAVVNHEGFARAFGALADLEVTKDTSGLTERQRVHRAYRGFQTKDGKGGWRALTEDEAWEQHEKVQNRRWVNVAFLDTPGADGGLFCDVFAGPPEAPTAQG